MEGIEFKYCFKDSRDAGKEIRVVKQDVDGLHADDVCAMFVDFMTSAGFTKECIYRYFNT